MLHAATPFGQAVTINLSVNYVDRVSSGGVRATGRVVRAGRSIYFSVGELVADDGRVIAMAHGSFKRSKVA
jgi:acyl-coenzyme A thioesterase PaaI-like protein